MANKLRPETLALFVGIVLYGLLVVSGQETFSAISVIKALGVITTAQIGHDVIGKKLEVPLNALQLNSKND